MDSVSTYDKALQRFVDETNRKIAKHYEEHLTVLDPPILSVDSGEAYDRVVRESSDGSRSVFCFVKKRSGTSKGDEIGDILKAVSWHGPAYRALGNIFNASRLTTATPFGVRGEAAVKARRRSERKRASEIHATN